MKGSSASPVLGPYFMRETGDGRFGKWEVLHFIALRVKPQINAETAMTEEKANDRFTPHN